MPVPIRIPNLLGGVSRVAPTLRAANQVEEMDNVELDPLRGAQKRPGTEFIDSGEGTQGAMDVEEPTNAKHISWINRASDERFVVIIDSTTINLDKLVQVFDLAGADILVEANGAVISDASNVTIRAYLQGGSLDIRRRMRALSVQDATFILNREVVTALAGGAATFQNTGPVNVRNSSAAQNVAAWSEFTQPPSDTAAFPSRAIRLTGGNILNDAIWFARDDDVGRAKGFYWAISSTQPPWFQRLRTEGSNSMIDLTTFPLRMDFDGTDFDITTPDYTDRLSGDSNTNPGPTFIGNAISDIAFHQDRLFMLTGEFVVSSRAADIFNLWIDSEIQTVDSDPIDRRLFGNRASLIDFAHSFREALILFTRGARQVELRANGPLAPSTAFTQDTTDVFSVEYLRPVSMGNKVYFGGERDFSMVIYEYLFDPAQFSNTASDITEEAQGYIPAEASQIVASEAHQQVFLITDADTNVIYVYRTLDRGGQKVMNAWHRWVFDNGNEILSIQPFDDFLYIVVRRGSLIFLERIPLGAPQQTTDTVNGTTQTLGYSIPIDRKHSLTGVYNAATDTTTWTLPFADATIDELILGPSWDVDVGAVKQRLAGLRLPIDVAVVDTTTVITTDGQFALNLAGNAALAFAGRSYTMDIELSEQFFRDEDGRAIPGNLQLMTARMRHKDTGFYALEVTPRERAKITTEFVVPFIGSTRLDSDVLDVSGEFQPRVMANSAGVEIHITNDKPVPSSIVDMEFMAEFVPFAKSPTR